MPINPNIALSFKPTYELESPQNIEANVMKLQGAKYANELARMQSQEYARGLQEQEGLRNYLAGNPDLSSSEAQSNAMRFGKPGLELLEAQAKRTKAGNESQESRVKLLGSKLAQSKDALEQYVKTPEQMRQYNAANIADPVIGEYMRSRGITLDQLNQEVDAVEAAGPQAFNRYLQKQVLGAKEFLKANEGKLYFPQGSDNAYVYNPYEGTVAQVPGLNTGASQRITPNQQFTQDIARQNLGFRERELALKEQEAARKSEPPAQKPLTQQQEIKLRGDVGKDYKAASTTISQMDDLLESINAVKTAPGLEASTGYLGKLPSMPGGQAAQAETRLANLKGKITALGKSVASMGGSIGSIATKEWEILANQIANIDPVKGKGPLLEQIDLIENQAIGAINRIKDGYEKTRGEDFERFPQFQKLPESRVLSAKKPQQPAAPGRPSNVDQAVWNVMTPEERALFANPNP